MKTTTGKDIPPPIIPPPEELQEFDIDQTLELGNAMRSYLLEVLVGQPDMYPAQLSQLPQSVRRWIQHTQERHEQAFIGGEYDRDTRFVFLFEELVDEFRKRGFSVAVSPREKAAFARNREGIKPLKSYCGDLFDILWDYPLTQKTISSDDAIMLEEILPGAFRYLQLRRVQLQDNSNTSDGVF